MYQDKKKYWLYIMETLSKYIINIKKKERKKTSRVSSSINQSAVDM